MEKVIIIKASETLSDKERSIAPTMFYVPRFLLHGNIITFDIYIYI